MEKTTISFNEQASFFDARAGLSDEVARQIASAVLENGQVREGDTVLEIGAGTGELGSWIARSDIHYIGIDNAQAMLDEFRARLLNASSAKLICTDADMQWPAETGSVRLIFGSRVFHLLDIDHVLSEVQRAAHPDGATLFMGKVKRQKDSVKNMMRDKMRELSVEQGLTPRPADKRRMQLLEQAVSMGGKALEPIQAAKWEARPRPIDSILSWRSKDSMGGIAPSPEMKEKILAQLEEWAISTFGDLEKEVPTVEKYILEGTRFSSLRS